jgi:peroxiredoxin Q/BCP
MMNDGALKPNHAMDGKRAPDFKLPCDTGEIFILSDFLKKPTVTSPLVLYFYPKDMTSGCTKEACDFQDAFLHNKDIALVGISRDHILSHQKFKAKYNLTFPLLSDEEGDVCQKYGVWVEKSMYGRKYFGIERSTFVIDEKGVILKSWRKVSIKNHVNEVLTFLCLAPTLTKNTMATD